MTDLLDTDEIDAVLAEVEHQKAVDNGLEKIPETVEEVIDVLFGGPQVAQGTRFLEGGGCVGTCGVYTYEQQREDGTWYRRIDQECVEYRMDVPGLNGAYYNNPEALSTRAQSERMLNAEMMNRRHAAPRPEPEPEDREALRAQRQARIRERAENMERRREADRRNFETMIQRQDPNDRSWESVRVSTRDVRRVMDRYSVSAAEARRLLHNGLLPPAEEVVEPGTPIQSMLNGVPVRIIDTGPGRWVIERIDGQPWSPEELETAYLQASRNRM